ncbi:MAG: DUF445 family protein [Desulfuromonadales bacterium]|nr:DUF445 family protein [Desulfuromonadales bacterium]
MQDGLTWLPWLIPPLLGGIIGYVTNHIAIRMLFRPLKPWRIFGVRLPLTPGIIPSKRGELAQRMGEMVGSHLLTSDDVAQALERPGFRRELKGAVNEKLAVFLDRELGSLESLVPAPYQRRFRELGDAAQRKLKQIIVSYLNSDDLEAQLRTFLRSRGDALLARDLESFLTPERYNELISHLDDRIGSLLQAPQTATAVGHFVDGRIERLLNSERSLRQLIPPDLLDVLMRQLEQEVPPLLERFGGLLHDPDFRQRLAVKGRQAIDSFLESLGGMAGLLSGFVNLEQIYDKIPEFIDRAGEELAVMLREEKTQQQVAAMLRQRLEGLLEKPLSSFVEKAPYEKVAGVRRYLRERSVAAVQSRRATEVLLGFSEQGLQKIKDRSFRSLLEQTLPEGGSTRLQGQLADSLLALLRSPELEQMLDRALQQQLEERLYRRPLGRLSERLPADVREELEESLYRQLGDLLKKEVPPLIETLNVARMVEEKVNTLDILQVEGLLMGVMQEQFKYINLFGALLGFLIGLLNIAVWWLL